MSDPNVVIISCDSLRAQNLPVYGYDKDTAPFLSKMAEEGSHIENYFSTAPWTLPAHASMFSGKLPSEHGTTSENVFFQSENKLVELFSEKDHKTILISENPLVNPKLGFSEGFDEFRNLRRKKGEVWKETWEKDDEFSSGFEKYQNFLVEALKSGDITSLKSFGKHIAEKTGYNYGEDYNPTYSNETLEAFEEIFQEDQNFFIFANLMPTHHGYTFNEEQREIFLSDYEDEKIREISQLGAFDDFVDSDIELNSETLEILESSYDASIRYLDSLIQEIYEMSPDNTKFIILGDHGELFGEVELEDRPITGHHFGTFNQLVKVPLIAFPLDQEFEGVYDHSMLADILSALIEEEDLEGKEDVFAEYYGRKGFIDQFGGNIPEDFSDVYIRQSFSIINRKFKYDITSDGSSFESGSSELDADMIKEKLPFVLKAVLEGKSLI